MIPSAWTFSRFRRIGFIFHSAHIALHIFPQVTSDFNLIYASADPKTVQYLAGNENSNKNMSKGYSQPAPLYDKLDFTGNICPIFEQVLIKRHLLL